MKEIGKWRTLEVLNYFEVSGSTVIMKCLYEVHSKMWDFLCKYEDTFASTIAKFVSIVENIITYKEYSCNQIYATLKWFWFSINQYIEMPNLLLYIYIYSTVFFMFANNQLL